MNIYISNKNFAYIVERMSNFFNINKYTQYILTEKNINVLKNIFCNNYVKYYFVKIANWITILFKFL